MQSIFDDAAKLPLRDAAYILWKKKYAIDRCELEDRPPVVASPKKEERAVIFKKSIREALANVLFERDNAHKGVTLHRLRRLHPNLPQQTLEAAVIEAVQFDKDCLKHFSNKCSNTNKEAPIAVQKARLANPRFEQSTYDAAEHDLMFSMR